MRRKKMHEIKDYDAQDTTSMIDVSRPMTLKGIGIELPEVPASQIVSIRIPTPLLNQIKAKASDIDIPYQALMKMILAKAVRQKRMVP